MAASAQAPPQPTTAQDILRTSVSGGAGPSSARSSPGAPAPDARSIFAQAGVDGAALHPLANVNQGQLDYLLLEDGKLNQLEGAKGVLPSRGWADELCYGTGTTYVSGLAAGALWGLREGLFKPLARATPSTGFNLPEPGTVAGVGAQDPFRMRVQSPLGGGAAKAGAAAGAAGSATAAAAAAASSTIRSPTFRLRLNNILNSMTRRGTFVGNAAGVLAVIYNACNSTIDSYRGKHDMYGAVGAGAMTGAVWKSTAGPRAALISSALMATGAAVWTQVKPFLV